MRFFLPALILLFTAPVAIRAQSLTVVPIAFSATEGNSSSSSLFQAGAASLQAYYSEAFLAAAGITPGVNISGLTYRRNTGGTTGPSTDANFSNFNILMSQSFADPASFTSTFASNVSGSQFLVRTGALTIPANSFPGGATPNNFGAMLNFDTPYAYTGGSLLIELRRGARTGGEAFNTDVDNTAASTVGARWLFNTGSDTATTGTIIVGSQIFQLQFAAVPEPTTYALIGSAGLVVSFCWYRNRQSLRLVGRRFSRIK